jgi:hypothetical protein
MLKRLKQRLRRTKESFRSTSRGGTPEPSAASSTNNPTPRAASPASSADPNQTLRPHEPSATPASALVSQSTVASLVLASVETPLAIVPQNLGLNTEERTAPLPVSSGILDTPPSTSQRIAHASWAGLNAFAGVLRSGANSFGPLKSAVDGIAACIEVYEVRAFIEFFTYLSH